MGIVASTLTSVAIRFAWNCQRFLDPRYRSIEVTIANPTISKLSIIAPTEISRTNESGSVVPSSSTKIVDRRTILQKKIPIENGDSSDRENRRRRSSRSGYRKRPSSFDGSLVKRTTNNFDSPMELIAIATTSSMPNTLKRQSAPNWDTTSSSCTSSDSSDSEIEFMYASRTVETNSKETVVGREATCDRLNPATMNDPTADDVTTNKNDLPKKWTMTAADEVAFRTTVGRGHSSRSRNHKFFKNLRLEKRLNGLNEESFERACRNRTRSFRKREITDLRTIV